MDENKKVFILIGPKGSGKSYVGTLLEQEFGLRFLRVEPLVIAHIDQHGLPESGLHRDGFDIEEAAIHEILATEDEVIFEATGSSIYFSSVLENLSSLYTLKLIRLYCPLDLCFDRVKNRSPSGHHFVSDEKIRTINQKAADVMLDWELEIDNSGPASNQTIISQFLSLIRGSSG